MLSLVDNVPPAPAEAGLDVKLVVLGIIAEVFVFFLEICGDKVDEGAADGCDELDVAVAVADTDEEDVVNPFF